MRIWHSADQSYFQKGPFISFPMRILLKCPYIYRSDTLAEKFSMDQYDLKNLGQGSSNKI